MLRLITAWAARRRLQALERDRQIVRRTWDEARRRGDTRTEHHAYRAHVLARAECLKAEMMVRGRA